jgi:hypothetical protein
VYELQEMKDELDAHYILMNDIDASETREWNVGDHDNDPSTPDSAIGFEPVGTFEEENPQAGFTGSLDGKNYSIHDLFINRPTEDNVGLFKRVIGNYFSDKNFIKNLALLDCYVKGHRTVGSLVGFQVFAIISECYVTGNVIGYSDVAGLCAHNNGKIFNCYSCCNVSGVINTAGFSIGPEYEYYGLNQNCYSIGRVSNEDVVYSSGFSFLQSWSEKCFWDIQKSECTYSMHGTPKTTAEMMMQSTFIDWDFDEIWCIDEGNDYPKLRVFGDCPPVDVEDISEVKSLNAYVYPNPAKDFINISIKNEIPSSLKIEIYDSMGNKLKKVIDSPYFSGESYKNTIDISDLSSGVYHIRIAIGDRIISQKLNVIR